MRSNTLKTVFLLLGSAAARRTGTGGSGRRGGRDVATTMTYTTTTASTNSTQTVSFIFALNSFFTASSARYCRAFGPSPSWFHRRTQRSCWRACRCPRRCTRRSQRMVGLQNQCWSRQPRRQLCSDKRCDWIHWPRPRLLPRWVRLVCYKLIILRQLRWRWFRC